jgi:hypothetical protein
MACTTLTTITKTCDNNIGGIRSIWMWDMEDQDTFTEDASAWAITALAVGSPTAPIGYEFIRNTSNYTEDAAIDLANGSSFVTQTISLMFARREATKSKAIKILGEGQRYLGALILDSNGVYWIFQDLQLSANGDGSGSAKSDGSKYSVTLLSEVQNLAKVMSTANALSFIQDGSTATPVS